jgi:hypothetical protein
MTENEWKTYRTRFLIKAKQLNSNLSFTDALGRQHCGRKGDYLVESFEGVLSIAPRQIFEDIYVTMNAGDQLPAEPSNTPTLSLPDLRPETSTSLPSRPLISTGSHQPIFLAAAVAIDLQLRVLAGNLRSRFAPLA